MNHILIYQWKCFLLIRKKIVQVIKLKLKHVVIFCRTLTITLYLSNFNKMLLIKIH